MSLQTITEMTDVTNNYRLCPKIYSIFMGASPDAFRHSPASPHPLPHPFSRVLLALGAARGLRQ